MRDVSQYHKKVLVATVDTDLVIIGLSAFFSLQLVELWIEYGTGKDKRWIPIHLYAKLLGERNCRALPFWYAFTGCDTTSQFEGRGKKTAW